MKSYANAKEVLPEELFQEVKKHYTGMLYVPKGEYSEAKKKLIVSLQKHNTPAKEIAILVGLSVRRINQIIALERRKNASKA